MNAIADTPLKKELTLTRLIDAPREMVFKAWTDPKQLARWWGPHGFTTPVCELDARKGGALTIHMASDGTMMPDNVVFPLRGEVVEYDPPARFAYTNKILEDDNGDFGMEALTTVTFAEEGGRTRLTVHEKVTKLEARAIEALRGFEVGMTQTLDKLETFVARGVARPKDRARTNPLHVETPAAEPTIVLTRTFDAPRALVWEAMTKAEHMARWWGPHGFLSNVTEFDARPGGKWRIVQIDPRGRHFVFHGEFTEVVAPERLVWTFGMEGLFDGRMAIDDVTLTESDGKTYYRAVSRFPTIADRDGMVSSGMEWGANDSMERLDVLLIDLASQRA